MSISVLVQAAAATEREQRLAGASSDAGRAPVLPDKLAALEAAASLFAEHAVPYALIGGLAVGVCSGVPRAKLDINFAVATRVDRARVRERLTERGFSSIGVFTHSDNFRHSSGEPVQLAYDAAFDPMIERAESMAFGSLALQVVTTADLIAMKRRAAADPGRRRSKALRDQADIALLEGDVPDADEGARSLLKESKYYFYDTGALAQAGVAEGAVFENAVACALQREVHLTEDCTGRKASLGFLRDKEKREVDFVVVIDRKPRQLVEAKLDDATFSGSLGYFRRLFPSTQALQVVKSLARPKDDVERKLRMVPAVSYLAEVSFLD
jgi:hypothetical protein